MRIELDSTTPIFQQIVEGIRSSIAAGVYRPGELIPSVRQQAIASLVNPNTVQRAYEHLERLGLIVSKKGTGMIVSSEGQEIAQDATMRGIRSVFVQGIAVGREAKLDRTSIDDIYRQSWKRTGKEKAEVIHGSK
jgi:GntR family transcriptional regulator